MEAKSELKVLAIGNSFSQDASTYVHQIAQAGGIQLKIVNLYIGGCPLERHWQNICDNKADYDFQLNGESTGRMVSIDEILKSDSWNFITLQQASHDSGKEETYDPYLENTAAHVRKQCPGAELLIHQTWSYEPGYERLNLYGSEKAMFSALKKAYEKAAVKAGIGGKPLRVLPCGQAMEYARENPIFQTEFGDGKEIRLNRDGFHASLDYGRFLLGAVWYEALTGKDIADNPFIPEGTLPEPLSVVKMAAHQAVKEYGWK